MAAGLACGAAWLDFRQGVERHAPVSAEIPPEIDRIGDKWRVFAFVAVNVVLPAGGRGAAA